MPSGLRRVGQRAHEQEKLDCYLKIAVERYGLVPRVLKRPVALIPMPYWPTPWPCALLSIPNDSANRDGRSIGWPILLPMDVLGVGWLYFVSQTILGHSIVFSGNHLAREAEKK